MACGVGDYSAALADALSRCDSTRVAVLTTVGADRANDAAYELFPVIREWHRTEMGTAEDVVRSWRPDVVHLQYPARGYGPGDLQNRLPPRLRSRRIPVVQTWHEHFEPIASARQLAFRRRADLRLVLFGRDVVVVRPEYREQMPRAFRILSARKRFHLIPNGASLPRVELDDRERAAIRSRLGAGDKALLVFFGLAHEHKGIDDALAAMDPARHHLVVVGDVDASLPYQAGLLRRTREPPLAGHVTISGFQPTEEAARILAAADAVVLPFRGAVAPGTPR